MNIICMYLPQYHRTPENDKWWGEGFTDWTAVKQAKPLFDKHMQPKQPLNNNYYDLLQKETMQWQSVLMKKYGIDGQCFYHYWFKNGRRILEKPAENWLEWKDIDMPLCFCWANESWARTWSNIGNKNTWADIFEKNQKGKTDLSDAGILLEQKYGEEREWKEHFEYLLPFFLDDRYIKIDNRPLFLIYRPVLITCLGEMAERWNEWAVLNGFSGIYFIGANYGEREKDIFDKLLIHEPQHGVSVLARRNLKRNGIMCYDYKEMWDEILEYESYDKNVIYGGFSGYDDTPRKGIAGTVIENQTPKLFGDNLAKLIAKNMCNQNDLIFINAWNEWGEGMYLEPDSESGYEYLERVLYARENYKKYLDQFLSEKKYNNNRLIKQLNDLQVRNFQNEEYWRIFDTWMGLKERGADWGGYFKSRNIKSIGIYGMGMFGNHLVKELEKTDIAIRYGIDRKGETIHGDLKIYRLEDTLPDVDAIVVTVTYVYDSIRRELENKGMKQVISLAYILEDLS